MAYIPPHPYYARLVPATHRDVVVECINRAIREYQISSFNAFGINISVSPPDDAREVYDTRGTPCGFHKYVFEIYGGSTKTMNVCVTPKGSVRIKLRQHWVRVENFLQDVKPSEDLNNIARFPDPRVRSSVGRGGGINTMKLPAELRQLICGFAIGCEIETYPTHKVRRGGYRCLVALARKPNTNLLHTCRQVYNEASNIIYAHTPFLVEHFGVAKPLLKNYYQRTSIRQLDLALPHEDFFRLFGGRPLKDGVRTAPSSIAKTLRKMKLTWLRLYFGPPPFVTCEVSLDDACQKTVVDWILASAWPWVRGHPVELSGYVKTKQKVAFQAACRAETRRVVAWRTVKAALCGDEGTLAEYDECVNDYEEEDGGVCSVEGLAAEQAALGSPVALLAAGDLTCRFKVSCKSICWDPDA